MKSAITRVSLVGAGVIALLIGGTLMASPKAFLEMSHVFVDTDPNLMSEMTAPGGVLILTGILLLVGAVRLRFANLALIIGAVIYGSYGISRLVSMALHGLPSDSLIAATVIELAIAALLGGLWATRPDRSGPVMTSHADLITP